MDLLHDLNKLYNKQKYLDRYGSSVVLAIIIFLIFFTLTSYFTMMNQIAPIRSDWVNQRCKPSIIPFAGIINPPQDGTSPFEYTQKNFNGCIQTILKETASNAMAPLQAVINLLHKFMMGISKALQAIRELINRIREASAAVMKNILHRILNIMIPVQEMVIAMKDLMSKSKGTMTTALFTGLGGYYTLKSALGAIYELMIAILVALAAAIVILWIVPFTWSTASMATTAMVAISIPIGILANFLGVVFQQASSPVPEAPSCFAEDTLFDVQNLGEKKISELTPGMYLTNGSRITAVLKLCAKQETMYNLNGIKVSGSHQVLYKDKWIHVSEHPFSNKILNFEDEFIYCVNTTTKRIILNDTTFLDWDEITPKAFEKLGQGISLSSIHSYYNNGFIKATPIELQNGKIVKINELNIGDVLKNGEKVRGLVVMSTEGMSFCEFDTYKESIIIGLGKKNAMTVPYHNIVSHYEPRLYHLLTDNGTFEIEGISFNDFNDNIDGYLK